MFVLDWDDWKLKHDPGAAQACSFCIFDIDTDKLELTSRDYRELDGALHSASRRKAPKSS